MSEETNNGGQGERRRSEARAMGLIAGSGELPILVAEGMRQRGLIVHAVGFAGVFNPELPPHCDTFQPVGLMRMSQWARSLRRRGVTEAVMVGRVAKQRMYDPFKWLHYVPDWRTARMWYRRLRHDRRSPALLRAVAEELQALGVTLIDSTQHIAEHLASEGPMTSRQPCANEQADIEFGWPILCAALEHGFGQAIAVRDRDVIAVEAIEGTDEMISRAGSLCRRSGWILLKGARRGHDRRADVPTIGMATIENINAAGGRCIALATGDVIIVEKAAVLKRADELSIAIVGITPPWRRTEPAAKGADDVQRTDET